MKPIDQMVFHPTSEKLVEILCERTRNDNPLFFRIIVAHYFTVAASMMRATVDVPGDGEVPINAFTINLATSGAGKGKSVNLMEDQVLRGFRRRFMRSTFPLLAEKNLPKVANERSATKGTDPDRELEAAVAEFEREGAYIFSFDSATVAAVKQARHKLLLANAGALNLQMDEFGSNMMGNKELLEMYLELYDVGKVKAKLIKNTAENLRNMEIEGGTPTNMLLFGTPASLLDASKMEEEFCAMLKMGYARRCLFGYSRTHTRQKGQTPEEILQQRLCTQSSSFLDDLSNHLEQLADPVHAHKSLQMSEETTLKLIKYQLDCEAKADAMPEHDEIRAAEVAHRHFKALKLAGAYAFMDGFPEVTDDHLEYSIRLVEESGRAFQDLMSRDKPYVKLAKYIAGVGRKVTQPDLVEDLPFYRGSGIQKQELINLAVAWGYQNNVIIRKTFTDGVEFLHGETLKETDLDNLRVSFSEDLAYSYQNDTAPFDKLHVLTQLDGMHWCNHHFLGGDEDTPVGHRKEDNALPGFNMIVLDVDHGINLSTAKMLLKDYKALFYTTKSHTEQDHRFRIILPTNYELTMEAKDYKEFMKNLFEWLPFEVDEATGQRARKWLSHNGHYEYQEGELFDVLPFIPKTSKNEQRKAELKDLSSLDNLERWVISNTGDGNRNNQLMRYAYVLVDAGFDFEAIRQKVLTLNSKLQGSLEEAEIMGTVMVTAGKAIAARDA